MRCVCASVGVVSGIKALCDFNQDGCNVPSACNLSLSVLESKLFVILVKMAAVCLQHAI